MSSLTYTRIKRIPVKISQLFLWITQSVRYQVLKRSNPHPNDVDVLFVCMTLDHSDRDQIFTNNQIRYPPLQKFRSVNGYDKLETIAALKRSRAELPFTRLHPRNLWNAGLLPDQILCPSRTD